jgi:hypothetical protein
MTSETFFPTWVTPLSILGVLIILIMIQYRRKKRGFNRQAMLALVNESIGAVYSLLFSLNICHQWSTSFGTECLLFKLPDSWLFIAFYVLVNFLDIFNRKWSKQGITQ